MNRKTKPPVYSRLLNDGIATSRTDNMQVIEHNGRKYVCKRNDKNKWTVKGSYDSTLPITVGVIE